MGEEKQSELEIKKLSREIRRLKKNNDLLILANEQAARTQAFIQKQNSRQLFYISQLMKVSPNLEVIADRDLKIVMVSDTIYNINKNISRDTILHNMNLRDLLGDSVAEKDLNTIEERCASVLKREKPEVFRLKGVARGVTKYVRCEIRPMSMEGQDEGLILVFIDETEIVNAMEDAQKANAVKSDFLANMSHEIRTPINAVLGMNEMIIRESTGAAPSFDKINTYAENIKSAGNNLLSIINDILDFSKIEAGKMNMVVSDYQLSSVLNDINNMALYRAGAKNLDFRIVADESLPLMLRGDSVRVRQIITNIVNNAVKYTEKGSVTLSASGVYNEGKEEGKNVDLVISVKDTGIGIKEESIGKLFDKFERMDLEKNNTIEGTGLGLAITKKLLDVMGGTIDVKSVYGEGSTFTVTIPQKIVKAENMGNFLERTEKIIREEKTYEESFRAPGARILIVDDTKVNIIVLKGLLKKTEMTIDSASGGAEAIKLATDTKYDIILMDQRMPGMNGTEAMIGIRTTEGGVNHETPVICLTADAISGAKERYMSEGFEDYLTKPVDGEALEEMLIRYISPDKVVTGDGAAVTIEEVHELSPEEKMNKILTDAGINPSVGMKYCDGDLELYRSVLSDYVDEQKENLSMLEKYYESGDWDNYGVLVHSIKGTSRMIGAEQVAELALEMEEAAKEARVDRIIRGHVKLLTRYAALARSIREFFGPT